MKSPTCWVLFDSCHFSPTWRSFASHWGRCQWETDLAASLPSLAPISQSETAATVTFLMYRSRPQRSSFCHIMWENALSSACNYQNQALWPKECITHGKIMEIMKGFRAWSCVNVSANTKCMKDPCLRHHSLQTGHPAHSTNVPCSVTKACARWVKGQTLIFMSV